MTPVTTPQKTLDAANPARTFGARDCEWLIRRYHASDPALMEALGRYSTEQFLRLFLTAHGMTPVGTWQTHTYARITDSETDQDHFFLIPIPRPQKEGEPRPSIRFENAVLWVDHIRTEVRPQKIPYTTPFWYFHYDPNMEERPFHSMTLNLKPACPEKCTLCAGAKTGRVNNGMEGALGADEVLERVFRQHPQAAGQLDTVAVVTGCFDRFESLTSHLRDVRAAAERRASPRVYRVLEHNVATDDQLVEVVGELGYDVFVTLECYDERMRYLALNGKVGRKGRDASELMAGIANYARYLDLRPELGRRLVHVTYLMGIDSLDVSRRFFSELAELNRGLRRAAVVPWLSVFTSYDPSMRVLQRPDFGLKFLIDSQDLVKEYFPAELLAGENGSTAEGYARGLF